jgi:hypothetical protein
MFYHCCLCKTCCSLPVFRWWFSVELFAEIRFACPPHSGLRSLSFFVPPLHVAFRNVRNCLWLIWQALRTEPFSVQSIYFRDPLKTCILNYPSVFDTCLDAFPTFLNFFTLFYTCSTFLHFLQKQCTLFAEHLLPGRRFLHAKIWGPEMFDSVIRGCWTQSAANHIWR